MIGISTENNYFIRTNIINLTIASAQDAEMASAGDFVAPSVASSANLPELVTGQIFYDLTAGAFKGINKSGTVDPLGAQGNPVSSDTPNERIERLFISSPCTPSPCTITFATGKFSAAPTCVITAYAVTNTFCVSSGYTRTSANYDFRRTSTEENVDSGATVISMGPR